MPGRPARLRLADPRPGRVQGTAGAQAVSAGGSRISRRRPGWACSRSRALFRAAPASTGALAASSRASFSSKGRPWPGWVGFVSDESAGHTVPLSRSSGPLAEGLSGSPPGCRSSGSWPSSCPEPASSSNVFVRAVLIGQSRALARLSSARTARSIQDVASPGLGARIRPKSRMDDLCRSWLDAARERRGCCGWAGRMVTPGTIHGRCRPANLVAKLWLGAVIELSCRLGAIS